MKEEETVQDGTEQDHGSVNTSNIYESQQETDYDFWTSEHKVHTSINKNHEWDRKYMGLLFLFEKLSYQYFRYADTCVLGKGWETSSIHC
jgi:hypothetical protein